jgi:hypothetical protein
MTAVGGNGGGGGRAVWVSEGLVGPSSREQRSGRLCGHVGASETNRCRGEKKWKGSRRAGRRSAEHAVGQSGVYRRAPRVTRGSGSLSVGSLLFSPSFLCRSVSWNCGRGGSADVLHSDSDDCNYRDTEWLIGGPTQHRTSFWA